MLSTLFPYPNGTANEWTQVFLSPLLWRRENDTHRFFIEGISNTTVWIWNQLCHALSCHPPHLLCWFASMQNISTQFEGCPYYLIFRHILNDYLWHYSHFVRYRYLHFFAGPSLINAFPFISLSHSLFWLSQTYPLPPPTNPVSCADIPENVTEYFSHCSTSSSFLSFLRSPLPFLKTIFSSVHRCWTCLLNVFQMKVILLCASRMEWSKCSHTRMSVRGCLLSLRILFHLDILKFTFSSSFPQCCKWYYFKYPQYFVAAIDNSCDAGM